MNHPNRNWRRRMHDLADQLHANTPAREAYRLGYIAGREAGRAMSYRRGTWCQLCERAVEPRLDRGDHLCPRCGLVL